MRSTAAKISAAQRARYPIDTPNAIAPRNASIPFAILPTIVAVRPLSAKLLAPSLGLLPILVLRVLVLLPALQQLQMSRFRAEGALCHGCEAGGIFLVRHDCQLACLAIE